MPKKVVTETVVYTYEELSEQAKEKVIGKMWDINVDHDWWESTYDLASEIGVKIQEFDLDRSEISIKFSESELYSARKIVSEWTHEWCAEIAATCKVYTEVDGKRGETWDKKAEEEDSEFKRAFANYFLATLQREYDYLTSKEQIIETIKSNGYEFLEDGSLF